MIRHFASIEALCAHEQARRIAAQAAADAAFSKWLADELRVAL